MEHPTNKAEVLELIRTARANLDEIVHSVDSAVMVEPGVAGEWSVKDTAAHIVDWERYLVACLTACTEGRSPELRETGTEEGIDRSNAETFLANRDRPLDEVLEEYGRSVDDVLRAMEPVNGEDLFDIEKSEAVIGYTGFLAWQFVEANTFEHYDAHADAIRRWLEARK